MPPKRHKSSHLNVILVAEPFPTSANRLAPLTPSPEVPFALLPVCNTPLLDYALENLFSNGADEVLVLVNPSSEAAVAGHIRDNRTARGRPWERCDGMRVKVHVCGRAITSFAAAIGEVRNQNVVPATGAFLLATVDELVFCTALRDVMATHARRAAAAAAGTQYIATLVCAGTGGQLLRDTYANALIAAEEAAAEAAEDSAGEGLSPTVANHSGLLCESFLPTWSAALPERRRVPAHSSAYASVPPLLIVMGRDTGVVAAMSVYAEEAAMAEAPVVSFRARRAMSARMDLVPTGMLVLDFSALTDVEDDDVDVVSFLNKSVLAQEELHHHTFGVYELGPEAAVVLPVTDLHSYLAASAAVCARVLFPMTRDSCFAEARSSYTVSATGGSVYTHDTARVPTRCVGPLVVVGADSVVAPGAALKHTVLGAGVTVGADAALTNCVVMDRVALGEGCTLRDCVVGPGARVAPGVSLIGCVVCAGASVDASAAAAGAGDAPGPTIEGMALAARAAPCALAKRHQRPLEELFATDGDGESDSDGGGGGDDGTVEARLARVMEGSGLVQAKLTTLLTDISTLCLTEAGVEARLNSSEVLARHVSRALFLELHRAHRGEGRAATLRAAGDVLSWLCKPLFNDVLAQNRSSPSQDAMVAVLAGAAEAMGAEGHALAASGAEVLRLLHRDADPALYAQRGYCAVSAAALRRFQQEAAADAANLAQYIQDLRRDEEEEAAAGLEDSLSSSEALSLEREREEEWRGVQEWQRRVDFVASAAPYFEEVLREEEEEEDDDEEDDDSESTSSGSSSGSSSSSMSLDYDL